jgi:AraC-like DNA-binding protein
MSKSRESHPPSAFLDMPWDDVPEVSITAPQSSQGWRAALSAVVAPNASLKITDTDARGVVSSVRRGVLTLFRIKLDSQEIIVKATVVGPTDIRMAVVLGGGVTYTSHSHRRRFGRGDIFSLSPLWDAYEIQTEDKTEIAIIQAPIWWMFDGRFNLQDMGWLGAQHLAIPADFFLSPVLLSAAHALFRHDGIPAHVDQAQRLLGAALIHTLNAAAPSVEQTVGPSTRFSRIHNYIMTDIASEDLSPQSAAKAMKISVRTLHQACANAGTTFGKIVADMRMSYAAYLLRNGSTQISEVAFSTGFCSLAHFCRLFKNKYGVSARKYRSQSPANGKH